MAKAPRHHRFQPAVSLGESSSRVPTFVRHPSVLPAFALLALLGGCGSSPTEPDVGYDLEVRWLGTEPTAATQLAFDRAVARIQSVVVGGLSGVTIPQDFNLEECDASLAGFEDVPAELVQGLIIYALVEDIDGPGNVLGSAGPCLVRQQDMSKPALGIMRLDAADLATFAQARLDQLILHETLHVVGFGTVWGDVGLLSGVNTADARFLGEAARVACHDVNGGVATCATTVPVHSEDGVGSAYSHWRESTFGNELMTPFLNAGAAPLSAMSMRALEDMGYEVDAGSADAYLVVEAVAAVEDATAPAIALPEPIRPRFKIGAAGTLTPLGGHR